MAPDLAEDEARPSAWERVTQLVKRGCGGGGGGGSKHRRPTTRASITDEGHATWRETLVAGVKRSHVAAGTWAIDGKDPKAQELKAVWGAMFMKLRPEQTYFVVAYSARQAVEAVLFASLGLYPEAQTWCLTALLFVWMGYALVGLPYLLIGMNVKEVRSRVGGSVAVGDGAIFCFPSS